MIFIFILVVHLIPGFYHVGGRGASEFHTFANIQILNGRARLEHMSACLFDVVVEHSEKPR